MTDQPENELQELAKQAGDTKIAPAHGIAAIALSLAMKYHDISTVQDGQLYDAYKRDGINMTPLHLDRVFETAIRIELHLLASEKRIADIVVEALEAAVEGEPEGPAETPSDGE